MPECDYCDASHESEEAHLEHLRSEHYDELGPIDRRRVDDRNEGSGFPTGPIAVGVVLLAAAGIVGYVVFVAGGSNSAAPAQDHYHGTLNVTITGDTFDFSRAKWKNPQDNPRFHFEGRTDDRWHAHAPNGVTLGYGMQTIGFIVEENSVTYNGTEYVDGEGYEVIIQVDGNDVSPDYVLKNQDHIRIVVRET